MIAISFNPAQAENIQETMAWDAKSLKHNSGHVTLSTYRITYPQAI